VEGGGRRKGDYRGSHIIRIPHHLVSAYPENPISPLAQECVARIVALRPIALFVSFAVDLDDQPARAAIEIGNIGIDRVLLAKADSLRRAA
jgi:hypothetical protein